MVNDPLPNQLTVKQLKKAIADTDDNAVVAISLPKEYAGGKELTTIVNIRIKRSDGPVLLFEPGLVE